jgi:hypothetical protein
MFSVELLVPSSKYVIAALVNHWFKNQACNMAHVMKILCSENWLVTCAVEGKAQSSMW